MEEREEALVTAIKEEFDATELDETQWAEYLSARDVETWEFRP